MQVDNHTFFALAEEQLAAGRQVRLALRGGSMRPTLREGDALLLAPAGQPPEVGGVYLFRYRGLHLVHRLVSLGDDGRCTMQGDHNRTVEVANAADLVGRLVAVDRPDGSNVATDSAEWRRRTRSALRLSALRRFGQRWFGRAGRRRLRPWYFVVLAVLMWAPLNGLGVPLDNYILGLRADHLVHASVYLPCTLFLLDLFPRRRWLAWLSGVGVGLLTESVQYLLPYRGFDINDMVANALGITLGYLLLRALLRHLRGYKSIG